MSPFLNTLSLFPSSNCIWHSLSLSLSIVFGTLKCFSFSFTREDQLNETQQQKKATKTSALLTLTSTSTSGGVTESGTAAACNSCRSDNRCCSSLYLTHSLSSSLALALSIYFSLSLCLSLCLFWSALRCNSVNCQRCSVFCSRFASSLRVSCEATITANNNNNITTDNNSVPSLLLRCFSVSVCVEFLFVFTTACCGGCKC